MTADSPPPDADLTSLMARFGEGDASAADALLPIIYGELRRVAAGYFRRQDPSLTLQPTALVNEAYLKLAGASSFRVRDRTHFFVLAARIMRQVLVDHARERSAQKRKGEGHRVTLEGIAELPKSALDLLVLEEALNRLAAISPERARLVELRFFAGLSSEEAADILGLTRSEAAHRWRAARAWLAVELQSDDAHDA